jgi:multidrug efflux system membrane fusion protein
MSEQDSIPKYSSHTSTPTVESEPRKGRRWVWAVLILLVVAAIVVYRMYSPSQPASAEQQGGRGQGGGAISVGTVPVLKKDVPFYLTGLGSVTALNTVTVHTRVDGEIMRVAFKEGQFVHAGDTLVEIDPRPFEVALDQAQGQLAKDIASQNDAKVDLGRYQTLWQEGVIARQQLDSQQATVGQFDGAIQSDQAQIANAKLQLTYSHITAPISGRVGLRLVDSGNIVHATDTNGMLVITEVQPISVIFTLPEDNLQQVVEQMKSRQLPVEAYSRDNNAKLADGILQTIDNQIDQTTGTIRFKAQFENRDLSLWPNQFVNIRLFLNVKKDALVIPSAAVQKGAQESFVYVIKPDNTAEYRAVQVDFSQGNDSVIRQGLKPEEQIVVDGQDKLQDGTHVVVRTNPAAGKPSGNQSQGLNQGQSP